MRRKKWGDHLLLEKELSSDWWRCFLICKRRRTGMNQVSQTLLLLIVTQGWLVSWLIHPANINWHSISKHCAGHWWRLNLGPIHTTNELTPKQALFTKHPLKLYPFPFFCAHFLLILFFQLMFRDFLVGQWLRLWLPLQGVWVRPLVWELRSHMPHSQKKKQTPKCKTESVL